MGFAVQARGERAVLQVVIEMLETEGYEAVRVREVAARARVSTRTIYESFGNRDDMIMMALEEWIKENVQARAEALEPVAGEQIDEALMRLFREIFAPWEQHSRLLMAIDAARQGPGGDRIVTFGKHALQPAIHHVLRDTDPAYARDVSEILYHVITGILRQVREDELPLGAVLSVIERTVHRLTESRVDRRD